MEGALDAIRGHMSAHSFATGPVIAEPFISPLGFTITPALSSKYMNVPSLRRHVFLWRMTTMGCTFLRSSGLPFFTDAKQKSPTHAAGRRFWRVPHSVRAIMKRFLAPLLSPQLITWKGGRGGAGGGGVGVREGGEGPHLR